MEKQEQKQIVGLDEFDNTVSLWQLLPAGAGRGLHRLKTIVNSIHNGQVKQSLIYFFVGRFIHCHHSCFSYAIQKSILWKIGQKQSPIKQPLRTPHIRTKVKPENRKMGQDNREKLSL